MQNNKLTTLEPDISSRLTTFGKLNSYMNEIFYQTPPTASTFSFVPTLVYLDLSLNKLRNLDALMFKGLNKLLLLSLESNQINLPDQKTFAGLSYIQKVCFWNSNGNELTEDQDDNLQETICRHRTPGSCAAFTSQPCCDEHDVIEKLSCLIDNDIVYPSAVTMGEPSPNQRGIGHQANL